MTTVLLTGVTSFIGRHLAAHLHQSGIKIIATYRTANPGLLDALAGRRPDMRTIQLDLLDDAEFDRLPPSIDAVVHVAGASPGEATLDDILNVNVAGTRNVQRYAMRAGAQKFIYTSSISVHGSIKVGIVDHSTAVNDPEPYGATKYLGERLLASGASTIPTVSIRLPSVIGSGAQRAWIPTIVERLISGTDVPFHNPTAAFNNAVHVGELSALVLRILLNQDWRGHIAFPIGLSEPIEIQEVINILRTALNSKSQLLRISEVKPSFIIDSSLAAEVFGYVPARTDETLRQYVEDILRR